MSPKSTMPVTRILGIDEHVEVVGIAVDDSSWETIDAWLDDRAVQVEEVTDETL